MMVRFLRNCFAPQQFTRPNRIGWYEPQWEEAFFAVGEEADPNKEDGAIDLAKLTYKVDYEIIAYP